MVKAIIDDRSVQEVLDQGSRRLKASRETLFEALQGELPGSMPWLPMVSAINCSASSAVSRGAIIQPTT